MGHKLYIFSLSMPCTIFSCAIVLTLPGLHQEFLQCFDSVSTFGLYLDRIAASYCIGINDSIFNLYIIIQRVLSE